MLAALGSPRNRLLFVAGIYTGFRIHELLSLRFSHVWRGTEPAREITVARQQLKGGAGMFARRVRSRTIAVHPMLRAAIQTYVCSSYPDGNPSPADCLFPSRHGINQPISGVQAYRIITAAAASAGNPARVGTHSLRKTFAKCIYERSGHDIILTKRALGHAAISSTARYLESTDDDVTTAIMGLPSATGLLQLDPQAEPACQVG